MSAVETFKEDHKKEYSPTSIEYIEDLFVNLGETEHEDPRADLQNNWASMKCLFKYQPLDSIKDYYGEKNAIYFGFVGTFISSLWIPSIVGVIMFIIGMSLYYM